MKKKAVREEFTSADIKEFEKRRNARLSGESKTYTWQQVKEFILRKKTR
jgi:hypothetical protein